MSSEEVSEKLCEAVVDFANAVEAAAVQLKQAIGRLHGITVVKEEPYEKLPWKDGEGAKGPYQSIKNNGSDLFRHLQAILKQNKGHHSEKDWVHYYWLGQDEETIFRRTKKRFHK